MREAAERLGAPDPFQAPDDDQEPGLRLPRPAQWGGYRRWAATGELWAEGFPRLHDRAFQAEPWQHERLQP
jgi:pyridoxine/pyridoxamine 5'-phosphate oxidase